MEDAVAAVVDGGAGTSGGSASAYRVRERRRAKEPALVHL